MDLGRFDLLHRSGVWATMMERGFSPVVASETITFRKSLAPWQGYLLESKIVGYDEKAVYLEQSFVVDGEVYAQGFIRGGSQHLGVAPVGSYGSRVRSGSGTSPGG